MILGEGCGSPISTNIHGGFTMKYIVIYRMSTSVYISTFSKSDLLDALNGEGSMFEKVKVLEEFPIGFQSSYGSDVNQGWPQNSLLILKQDCISVPRVTKKLLYYSLED